MELQLHTISHYVYKSVETAVSAWSDQKHKVQFMISVVILL